MGSTQNHTDDLLQPKSTKKICKYEISHRVPLASSSAGPHCQHSIRLHSPSPRGHANERRTQSRSSTPCAAAAVLPC